MEAKRLQELFNKWVEGALTEKEETELMRYLSSESSEPDRMRLSASLYEQTAAGTSLDPGIAESIVEGILRPQREPRRILPAVWRYAAVFAGVMALGAAAWLFSGKKPRPLTAAAGKYTTIPTNHNRAVLVLEDGRNVDLGSDRSSHIRQGQAELTHTDSAALRYTATGASQPAGVNTLYIPRGAKYKVELADGSEIWLNAESKLRYPVAFGGASKREVFLESGEAYFKVRKNTALPFIVHTKGMAVEVLGTEFDVNTYSKTVATTLVQGSVRLNAGVAAATLRPGEQGILTEDKFTSSKVETELYTAWVNNQMLCVETPLEDVMERLGREYDFTVDYASPQLRERRFGGRLIMAEHIEDVLAIIEQTAYVKFSIKGKTILVSPDSSR